MSLMKNVGVHESWKVVTANVSDSCSHLNTLFIKETSAARCSSTVSRLKKRPCPWRGPRGHWPMNRRCTNSATRAEPLLLTLLIFNSYRLMKDLIVGGSTPELNVKFGCKKKAENKVEPQDRSMWWWFIRKKNVKAKVGSQILQLRPSTATLNGRNAAITWLARRRFFSIISIPPSKWRTFLKDDICTVCYF